MRPNSLGGQPGPYSAPPPIRRDEDLGAVTGTWVHVIEPSMEQPPEHFAPPVVPPPADPYSPPIGVPQEPDSMPSFTRTTGGTITTFLPKEPPGSSPKLSRPAFDASFAPEISPAAFADAFSSPTTDLPAGFVPFDTPAGEPAFDELATDVLPAGGFPIAELLAEPSQDSKPMRAEGSAVAPKRSDDQYDSDAELDALLADLSAVVSPFLPTEDLPDTPVGQAIQPLRDAPAEQPLRPPSALPPRAVTRRPRQALVTPSPSSVGYGQAKVERLTEYPTPRSVRAGPILDGGSQGTPAVRMMQGRPPMANIAFGPTHEFDTPTDGVLGVWVRFFAILVTVGLAAGAISYALMS